MSVTITSTTDSNEAVTNALGDVAQGKSAGAENFSAVAPENELAEKPEVKKTSDKVKLDDSLDETKESDKDEDDSQDDDLDVKDDVKPKKKGGFRKRIDKLTTRLSAKEQEAEYWKNEAMKHQRQEKPESKPNATPKTDGDDRPRPDDFDSHDAYVDALTDWKVDHKLSARDVKQKESEVKGQLAKQVESHLERVKEFSKTHDDFNELMEDVDDIAMSVTVQEVILNSDNGAELMYELAKNREEYERICKLPAIACARELGKFEMRIKKESLNDSKPTKKTNAPPPINPVGAKGSGASLKSPDEMSFQEYKKWREGQNR